MDAYLDIVMDVMNNGILKNNRTGIPAKTIPGATFKHDMSEGFPLLTTKKIPVNSVFGELEFFIRGYTDKKWLQDRKITIWDEWCGKINHYHEPAEKDITNIRELGPIYGFQWRHFGAQYRGYKENYDGQGIDQLANLVDKLKTNPEDRRMIVSAWNPLDLEEMALAPCHLMYHATVLDGKLNLNWTQRSVDVALGLPFNIASYALLLHLLAKEGGFKEGILTGQLEDTHIYENCFSGINTQLQRTPYKLPKIETQEWNGIFNWKYTDTKVIDYEFHPRIKMDVAV